MKASILYTVVLGFICLLLTAEHVFARHPAKVLTINALNDRPGPVRIRVTGRTRSGGIVVNRVLLWRMSNNRFSNQSMPIPRKTRYLRFTFINDVYGGGSNPDADRNAFINFFVINGRRFEAEHFSKTGGPDRRYPGCGARTLYGKRVIDCGNQGDFVEYDLLHLASPGPGYDGVPVDSGGHVHNGLRLRINAKNDRPGPVQIRVIARNASGAVILRKLVSWGDNNNIFSTKTLYIPRSSRRLRFRFVNDYYRGGHNPENDRNAFIDYFTIGHHRYEAEDFDRTGGPDRRYPGCTMRTLPNRTVADCGNQGDYVEYDLGHVR